MHVFKHPKFYEEMRQRAKKFQKEQREAASLKQQASSTKPEGPSDKPQAPSNSRNLKQDS